MDQERDYKGEIDGNIEEKLLILSVYDCISVVADVVKEAIWSWKWLKFWICRFRIDDCTICSKWRQ